RGDSGGLGCRRDRPAPSRTRPAGCRVASRARALSFRTASTGLEAARSRSGRCAIHRSWLPPCIEAADVNGRAGEGNRCPPSFPGLTPQVGVNPFATHTNGNSGKPEFRGQSFSFPKNSFAKQDGPSEIGFTRFRAIVSVQVG